MSFRHSSVKNSSNQKRKKDRGYIIIARSVMTTCVYTSFYIEKMGGGQRTFDRTKKKKMSSNIDARAKPVRVHTQSQKKKKLISSKSYIKRVIQSYMKLDMWKHYIYISLIHTNLSFNKKKVNECPILDCYFLYQKSNCMNITLQLSINLI